MAVTYVGGDANGGNVDNLTGVTWPTHQNNDYAFLQVTLQDTTALTSNPPTGFTQLDSDIDGSVESILFYKVCNGTSESGDISLTFDTINRVSAVLSVYRGMTGTPTVASAAETGTDTTHDCPSVSFSGSQVSLVTMSERVNSGTTSGTAPSGYTKRHEFGTGGTGGTYTGIADNLTAASSPIDPGDWTGTTSASNVVTRTIAVQVASGAVNVDAGLTTETDSAQAHGKSKRAASGLSSSAATSQAFGRLKSAGVGQAL